MHSPAVERLVRRVRRLADHCPVLMLQGTFSHEPPGTLSIFRLLGVRFAVHVADRIEQVVLRSDASWLASDGWCFDALPADAAALFSCVPTVNKATVAASVGAAAAATALGQELAALLAGFGPGNRAARAAGVATIGVSHGTVSGCLTEHGVPMAGFDHEFTTGTLFAAEAQAFMLGHIHRHQGWVDPHSGRRIAYPGSIGRFHYGEEGAKGFLLWELDPDAVRVSLIPTPARRTVDLRFDGKPDLDAIRAVAAELDGAFVRVRWCVAVEDRHDVDRAAIERALSGAAELELEGRIIPVVRSRVAGISGRGSIADKVGAWAQLIGADVEPLLRRLQELQHQGGDDIARSVLAAAPEASGAVEAPRSAESWAGALEALESSS